MLWISSGRAATSCDTERNGVRGRVSPSRFLPLTLRRTMDPGTRMKMVSVLTEYGHQAEQEEKLQPVCAWALHEGCRECGRSNRRRRTHPRSFEARLLWFVATARCQAAWRHP